MKRTRIATGIYQDKYGLSACVKVGSVQREKRFHPDEDLAVLESWRIQTRAQLDTERTQAPKPRGTLKADGERFLTHKAGLASARTEGVHLRAWFPAFGSWLRSKITRVEVQAQIAKWREAGIAARTIRHRCRLLRQCYTTLDGRHARTPLDDVQLPTIPAPNPSAVPLQVIRAVAKNLKAANRPKDYARFLVRVTTGQRPAQIMRATPDDVDLKKRIWFVRPAKGGTAIAFPLNAEAVRAWKIFIKADAWGTFGTKRAAIVLRRYGWPATVKPYALRHTFAIDLLSTGYADVGDVQRLLGHRSIQTTNTTYVTAIAARLTKATNRRTVGV